VKNQSEKSLFQKPEPLHIQNQCGDPGRNRPLASFVSIYGKANCIEVTSVTYGGAELALSQAKLAPNRLQLRSLHSFAVSVLRG
jgi:hypothetical protein